MKTLKLLSIGMLTATLAIVLVYLTSIGIACITALSLMPVALVMVIHRYRTDALKQRLNASIEESLHREMYSIGFDEESEEASEAMIDALIEQQRNELRNRFKRIDCE